MSNEIEKLLSEDADAWCEDTAHSRALEGKTIQIKSPTGKVIGVFRMHVREVDADGNRKAGHIQIGLEPVDTDAVCATISAMQPFKNAVIDRGSAQPI